VLDLTSPPIQTLKDAAQAIQMTQQNGKVLVCCALGMQRSAAAVGLWLVQSGKAANGTEAVELLRRAGRPIHIDPAIIDGALAA
jgi:protein-tyrosine phosphatase